jgi:hypothetical protein
MQEYNLFYINITNVSFKTSQNPDNSPTNFCDESLDIISHEAKLFSVFKVKFSSIKSGILLIQ